MLTKIRHQLYAFFILAIDALPEVIVKTGWYFRLRKRISQVPERFEPYPAVLPSHGTGIWRGRKIVTPETDLVIEGYPGSANSFTANSIADGVRGDVFIESHFHHTVQLKRARVFGVPAVVLVRSPVEAASSLKSKEPSFIDVYLLLRWILYYRYVRQKCRSFCIVFFEDVVRDIDIIRRNCPAVQQIIKAPIRGNVAYRRSSKQAHRIDENRRINRFLLATANKIYADLRTFSRSGTHP